MVRTARSICSAFPLDGPITDIRAVEAAIPLDGPGQRIGTLLRSLDVAAQRCGAEYPASLGDDLAVAQRGAGVKDLAVLAGCLFKAADYIPLAVVAGVAASGQNHAETRARTPPGLGPSQPAVQCGLDQLHQAALQAQHDRLGFGIAEAAVELDDLGRAAAVDHQAGIQE